MIYAETVYTRDAGGCRLCGRDERYDCGTGHSPTYGDGVTTTRGMAYAGAPAIRIDPGAEKKAANSDRFREYFVRYQPLPVVLSVLVRAMVREAVAGRRVTRQHKTRQVKNI
jgi:hypothetical protein